MRIAIFGAGGFIGSHLVEHLLASSDHELAGLDVEESKLEGIQSDRFLFYKADVRTSPDLVEEVVRQSDVVIDLIAHAKPSLYVEVPLEVVDLNLWENLKVIELCVKHGKRLIQYSSCEVYGKPTLGAEAWVEDESDSVYGPIDKQRWIYACAKQLLERILFAHGQGGDLEYTIIRPFNFVGPRMDYLVAPQSMGGPRVFAHFMSSLL
ncbi:MAG: NAD-dependent epimerase/dehydratase family protein, partial [Acidimicrobiia bacterium]